MMKSFALAATILVVIAAPALAAPEDIANDISMHVMSPYCPGVTLHDCPSDAALALRARIVAMAEDGFTRAQIMDELEAEFGETIRAVPPAEDAGLLAWILPGLAALAGAALAWVLIRRWARPADAPQSYDPDAHITAADRKRLDAELRKLRGAQ